MDTTNRRPQLPALSYLDVDKVKREEEVQQSRTSGASHVQHSAPAASPSYPYPYPAHPPPSHSHPPPRHASTWPDANSHTPPDSRRASGEDNDGLKKAVRQSLPSISEALGDPSFSHSTAAPLVPPLSAHLPPVPPAPPASPPPLVRKAFAMEPPQSHNSYSNGPSPQFATFRQDSAGPPSYPTPESAKLGFGSSQETRPPLQVQTSQAPPQRTQQPASYPQPQSTSPQYEQSPGQSGGSMGPPTAPYGYTPYNSRYSQPTSSSQTVGPIYQPSTQFAAPPTPSPGWKSESASSHFVPDDASATPSYGESVKRHLDIYDLEGALNEISRTSGIMQDFSRRYGDQMHRDARSGPSLSSLPSMVEVEDMMSKARIQLDSLNKIREVILAQQAAYEQQIAEQRQHKAYSEQSGLPPAGHLDDVVDKDGFAGPDAKKRRGRAAPPGRCHSCNRAETPEWRRGPDGARTLCNACGLHYAKLTRKNNGANKVSASNLRPKES